MQYTHGRSGSPFRNDRHNLRHRFRLRLRGKDSLAVQANRNVSGFHIVTADDEHGVDPQWFHVLNVRLDRLSLQLCATVTEGTARDRS